jgi:anti-sigma factor RsiW
MTEPPPHLPPATEADLVALADGQLDRHRRAEVEALAAADPALAAALDEQRAALAAVAAVTAPAHLRDWLETAAPGHDVGARRRFLPRALVPLGGLAAAVVAVVLALTGGPGVEDVMAAAGRTPTAAVQPGSDGRLGERIGGVAFPDYAGWRAVGTRTDTIGGRDSRTVFYARGGSVIAYTILAGDPVAGAELAARRDGGRTAVTWQRGGRTCVLSGVGVSPDVLAELAGRWY